MTDLKISALPAITTPAQSDQFATEQAGVTYRTSRQELHTLGVGESLVGNDGGYLNVRSNFWVNGPDDYTGIEVQSDLAGEAGTLATYNIESGQYAEISTYGSTYVTPEYPAGGAPAALFFSSDNSDFVFFGNSGDFIRLTDVGSPGSPEVQLPNAVRVQGEFTFESLNFNLVGEPGTTPRLFFTDQFDSERARIAYGTPATGSMYFHVGAAAEAPTLTNYSLNLNELSASINSNGGGAISFTHNGVSMGRFVGSGTPDYFELRSGTELYVRDSDNDAYGRMSHDGTNFQFTFVGTGDLTWGSGATGQVNLLSDQGIRIYDPLVTDYAQFRHNGTDFYTEHNGTRDWIVSGLTGDLRVEAVSLEIHHPTGNTPFVAFYDNLGARQTYAQSTVSGWNFRSEVHGAPINFEGEDSAGDVQPLIRMDPDGNMQFYCATNIFELATSFDIRNGSSLIQRQAGGLTDYVIHRPLASVYRTTFVNLNAWEVIDCPQFWIKDAGELRISDVTDLDSVIMSHDGTDFNIEAFNTTNIVYSGMTNGVRYEDELGQLIGEFTSAAGDRQLILPQINDQGDPTLAFGDGDTGLFELSDDFLAVSIAGTYRWAFSGVNLQAQDAAGPQLASSAASSTNPTLRPNRGDANSGIGQFAADTVSMVAGGTERGRFEGGVLSGGETSLWLYDADNAKLEQVTVGAADSGGSGFKVLRIPN